MRPPQRMKARTATRRGRSEWIVSRMESEREGEGKVKRMSCVRAPFSYVPIQPLLMGLFATSCFFTAVCGLPRLAASDLAKRSLARRC